MLCHTSVEWYIIVLAPSTEWVKKEDWILISKLKELLTSVLQEEDVSIVKGVSDLESIDGISILRFDHLLNLSRGLSIIVEAIVECHSLRKAGCSRDEEVTLFADGLCLRVVLGPCTEGSCADLFLSVVKEDWLADDSDDIL